MGKTAEIGLERHVSGMLQQMRVPHVTSMPAVVPSALYTQSIWFPQPKAVLDMDRDGDRLASGALGGAAGLRRQQLRAVGLRVHTLDMSAFKSMSRGQRLRTLAEAVAESCPEAAAWLQRAKTASTHRTGEQAVEEMPSMAQTSEAP